jgi:hypothetical protein
MAPIERDSVVVLSSNADYTSARYQDLLLQIWHKQTTLAGVAAFRHGVSKLAAERREGLRVLVIVEPGASLPPRECRSEIAEVMVGHKRSIRAAGLAFEGTGFGAASIRAVVTGLNLLAQHPFPYRVFSSISEALAWEPMASPGGTPAILAARTIRAFRDRGQQLAIAS